MISTDQYIFNMLSSHKDSVNTSCETYESYKLQTKTFTVEATRKLESPMKNTFCAFGDVKKAELFFDELPF